MRNKVPNLIKPIPSLYWLPTSFRQNSKVWGGGGIVEPYVNTPIRVRWAGQHLQLQNFNISCLPAGLDSNFTTGFLKPPLSTFWVFAPASVRQRTRERMKMMCSMFAEHPLLYEWRQQSLLSNNDGGWICDHVCSVVYLYIFLVIAVGPIFSKSVQI